MKVILPLAGRGTRLRPHTHSKPKPLINLAGKTVLAHIIEGIVEQLHVEEFLFIIDPRQKEVENYIRENFKINFKCLIQEEPLGPGHAVWIGKDEIKEGDNLLVVYCDTIFVTDLKMIENCEYDGLIFTKKTDEPERFGIATVENGMITGLVEKPKEFVGDLAVVGMYYFKDGFKFMQKSDEMVSKNIMEKGEFYINTPILQLINEGWRFGAPVIDEWLDCGKIDCLLATNKFLLKTKGNNKSFGDNNLIINPVFIGENVTINNSVIGPYVSITDNTEIKDSILRNSIIGRESKLENVNLDNSVVGDNVVLKGIKKELNVGDHSEIKLN